MLGYLEYTLSYSYFFNSRAWYSVVGYYSKSTVWITLLRFRERSVVVKKLGALFAFVSAVVGYMLIRTSPEAIGIRGITLFFILFYAWSFLGMAFLSFLLKMKLELTGPGSVRLLAIAVLAFVPTSLLALSSTKQLSFWDVSLVLAMVFSTIFYWSKRLK